MAESVQPVPAGQSIEPSAEDWAFFDYRFRFAERGDPVIEALYAVAAEWLLRNGYTKPAAAPPKVQNTPVKPVDPIDIIQLEVRLPPLPASMLELQEVLQRRHFSAENVAKVISKDPGLTAWLLKLVNSPYYGFSNKVSTISHAVVLVGTRQIQTLAVGGALNSLAVLMPKGLLDMELFWRHSVAVGIIAQELWKVSGRKDSEQLFVCGLLHDCGKLALAYAAPKILTKLNTNMDYSKGPGFVMEKALLDFDHARLGGMLLHRWNMPLPLVIAVLRHHQVDDPMRYPEAAAVHVADAVATAIGLAGDPEAPVPPIASDAWQVLGLPPQVLGDVVETLRGKLDELCSALQA